MKISWDDNLKKSHLIRSELILVITLMKMVLNDTDLYRNEEIIHVMDLIDKIYNLINEVMCAEYTAGMTLEINGAEVDKCNLCPQNTEDEYVLLLDLNQ